MEKYAYYQKDLLKKESLFLSKVMRKEIGFINGMKKLLTYKLSRGKRMFSKKRVQQSKKKWQQSRKIATTFFFLTSYIFTFEPKSASIKFFLNTLCSIQQTAFLLARFTSTIPTSFAISTAFSCSGTYEIATVFRKLFIADLVRSGESWIVFSPFQAYRKVCFQKTHRLCDFLKASSSNSSLQTF